MEDFSQTILETDRLRLVPVSKEFAQEIFKEFTPEITLLMVPKPAEKIEDTLNYIESASEKNRLGQQLAVVILDKITGEFLGAGGIHQLKTDTPELGIWIKKSAHGNGYGKETVTALYNWAKEKFKYKYIKYPVDKRNLPSRRIPESLGGIIGREYQETSQSGKLLEIVEYRIYHL